MFQVDSVLFRVREKKTHLKFNRSSLAWNSLPAFSSSLPAIQIEDITSNNWILNNFNLSNLCREYIYLDSGTYLSKQGAINARLEQNEVKQMYIFLIVIFLHILYFLVRQGSLVKHLISSREQDLSASSLFFSL